ncbi:NapC/NirT family cytochrome c [Bacillus sp. 1NLA3E]|uniref:NapC/NirT family cytochrome c n=1 Tax=Bacillus sp. 1NLA3E TaxID=666686 RepID=UPI000247ECE4|nr:NapC/NirT family cytochrome c [Bacillus sp. 1NLA3E]AGK55688.1 NapC/NirT cytochrome c domain protein [Bacillus sp. 1NLA3E]
MDSQQIEQPTPPKSQIKYKFFKIMTLTLFFITVFIALGYVGVETSSSSKFCSSCHEMKPEYYTWKASTHSEVDCVNCHISPGAKNYSKAKANGLLQVFKKETNTYTAPIQMPKDIPNSACEKCHDMKTRQTTPSGDLIIPHDKHIDKDIACIQCHSGVAHGKISERKVTFKTDYEKWDTSLGQSMMSDIKFTSPKMEKCMDCHEARDVSTACKTCHTTGMVPKSHKKATFKTETHGQSARKDVEKCHSCHQYMSDQEIKDMKEIPASQQFLSNGTVQEKSITAQLYAKENTFCKKCHSIRPPSHIKGFISMHGPLAKKDKEKCLTCHDYQNTGQKYISKINCSSCHPASHEGNTWRLTHPIELPVNQKVNQTCYTCHFQKNCSSCHKE